MNKMKKEYKIVKVPIESEVGEGPGYYDMIDWWLENYKGLEHFHVAPEIMYAITSILGRCLNKLKTPNPPIKNP